MPRSGARGLMRDVAQVMFGPWPIRPVLIGFITFVVFQYGTGVLAVSRDNTIPGTAAGLPVNALRAAAVAGVLALLLLLHRRVTGRTDLTRGWYVGIVLVTALTTGTTRYFLVREIVEGSLGLYVAFVLRAIGTLGIMMSAVGVAEARLRRHIRETDAALDLVRTQRQAVLESEERARQSIATLLHDRVQAGLVAAMLQLRPLAKSLDDENAARLQSVIADLEAMRTQDVREASRRLSPDLRNMSLEQAIKLLASTYEPAMTVTVQVDAVDELSTDAARRDIAQLAVYRIVEQALLNAAVHGQATRVDVTCRRDGRELVLSVADNGRGISSEPISPGAGSAVIDAWTGALDGEWSLSGGQLGTELDVRFRALG